MRRVGPQTGQKGDCTDLMEQLQAVRAAQGKYVRSNGGNCAWSQQAQVRKNDAVEQRGRRGGFVLASVLLMPGGTSRVPWRRWTSGEVSNSGKPAGCWRPEHTVLSGNSNVCVCGLAGGRGRGEGGEGGGVRVRMAQKNKTARGEHLL